VRRIFGPKRERERERERGRGRGERKLHNEELHNFTFSSDIIYMMKSK
jgi:hypothetical protein